jgi:ribokinase
MRALQQEHVSATHVAVRPGSTGVAMVTVESSGQNCIALHAGANELLSVAQVDAAASLIGGASMLVCQLESPLPSVLRAIEIARKAGVPVLLNPAPAQPLPADVIAQIDFLVPNETEAAILADAVAHQDGDVAPVALALHALGARTVIVTCGARGVCVVDTDGRVQQLPAHPVPAVDTTGAGDAFIGALAVACERGDGLLQGIAFAQAVAAISVTREGAMPSFPTRYEVQSSRHPHANLLHRPTRL